MNNTLYKLVEEHVTGLFEVNPKPKLFFHSFGHTKQIVKRTQEISSHYDLDENQKLALFIASWFHDTGHLFTTAENHEEKSVELMKSFMQTHAPDPELIKTIERCIMATKRNIEPTDLLEQIICDADTYHLGTKDFRKTNKLVRKEVTTVKPEMTKIDWDVKTLEFLEKHKYYTSYCKELLEKGKQENMERLRQKIVAKAATNDQGRLFTQDKQENSKTDKQTSDLISKGIQTMLRTASSNHLRLSYMADRKANILISVNAIIISVSISVVFKNITDNRSLMIPTIISLCFSVTTIILSILATRPNITGGNFTKEDITNKKINLLFFGNFYKATLDDYRWGMSIMMRDPEYLYGSLIKDVYYLGVVLARKYKLLHLAYNIFMIGIVISVIAFAIFAFAKSPESTPVITTPSTSPL